MTDCVVGMVTCSSRVEARKLAKAVLAKKLAACINIIGALESHYWWKGKLERAGECLLLIKTTRAKSRAVEQAIRAAHSYDVPEIIFLSSVAGERRYLKWLRSSMSGGGTRSVASDAGRRPRRSVALQVKRAVTLLLIALSVAGAKAGQFEDLVKQLGSTNEEDRAEAAESLTQIGGPRAQKQFREMIASSNPEHRQMAAVGLLQVSDEDEDLERVHKCLKDENSTVRWSAVVALGQSGRLEAIPCLDELAKSDTSDSVREAAGEAVARLRASPQWVRTLLDALKQGRELKKPVLAYFFLRDSEYCQKLEEGLFTDRAVLDEAEKFVCARVNAATEADVARKFDVRGAPTILLLDGDGNEMTRVTGLVDKPALLAKLSEARRSKLTFREAKRLAQRNPADVQANWKVAEGYLEESREDLAEPHLRNVVEHDEENRYGFTDNAMFALGYCLGRRGEYAQAVYSFEHLLERWPNFKDKDKALYCLGLSQLALGRQDKGRAALEQLIREFPDGAIVKSAKVALDKLEAKDKGHGQNH
jgi:periplasmic divalent cation tolerance protein